MRDLVPFAQFKKYEKRLWRSVTFSKVPGFNMFETKKLIVIGSRFVISSNMLSEISPGDLSFE